jgi:hypothetical protein
MCPSLVEHYDDFRRGVPFFEVSYGIGGFSER